MAEIEKTTSEEPLADKWLQATAKLMLRAHDLRRLRAEEEPRLLEEIEAIFKPAVRWFLGTFRGMLRPWPAGQGPDAEALGIHVAAEWRATYVLYLQETVLHAGSITFDVPRHVGDDLWPRGLYPVPHIAVSESFNLSAKGLSKIGTKARESLPAGAGFPEAAARWLELLGYEVKR